MDSISQHLTLWSLTCYSLFLTKDPKFCSLSPLNLGIPLTTSSPSSTVHGMLCSTYQSGSLCQRWMSFWHSRSFSVLGLSPKTYGRVRNKTFMHSFWALPRPFFPHIPRSMMRQFFIWDTYCSHSNWSLSCSMQKKCFEDWICSQTGIKYEERRLAVKSSMPYRHRQASFPPAAPPPKHSLMLWTQATLS